MSLMHAAIGLLLFTLAVPPDLLCQDSTPPDVTIRTTTRVVMIDAVVTDSNSKPVPNLKPEDFTVLEDGKPQKISFFAYETPQVRQQLHAPPKLRPDVFTNRPEYHNAAGPMTVILLDALNTPPNQQIYARQQLLKYLATAKLASTGTAILALGNELSVLQSFTTSPELLTAAVKSYVAKRTAVDTEAPRIDVPVTLGPGSAPAAANLNTGASSDVAGNIASQTNVTNSFAELAESLKRFDTEVQVRDQDRRILDTLNALRTIAKALQGYPGRKSLLWVSASFPFSLALDDSTSLEFSKSYRDMIHETSALLSDSSVAVYPIDTHGLLSMGGLADPSAPTKMASSIQDAAPSSSLASETFSKFGSEMTMDQLARETGGEAFRNTNDLAGAVHAAIDDSDQYYTLGYYPERKKWDGKFHKVKVVLANRQLKVRAREGYYAVDPSNWRKAEGNVDLIHADSMSTLNATGLLFYAHVVTPEKKGQQTTVEILLDANTVSYGNGSEGTYTTDLEFEVGAFTPGGKLQKREKQIAEADLRRETYAQLLKTGMPVRIPISVDPGRYLVRVAVRDNRNGHLGTVDIPVTIKAFN
jgi:VWFA-related protein